MWHPTENTIMLVAYVNENFMFWGRLQILICNLWEKSRRKPINLILKRNSWAAGVADKLKLKEKFGVLELHSMKFATTLHFVRFGGSSIKFLHVATNQIWGYALLSTRLYVKREIAFGSQQ